MIHKVTRNFAIKIVIIPDNLFATPIDRQIKPQKHSYLPYIFVTCLHLTEIGVLNFVFQ